MEDRFVGRLIATGGAQLPHHSGVINAMNFSGFG